MPTDDAPIILNEDLFDFGMQAMVMGTDTAGRLNEEAMIQWWKDHTNSAEDTLLP